MRILYQFPLSHFCEKARWLLDHKELDFVAQNVVPGVHRAFAQLKTGQNKLPILRDQDIWIADTHWDCAISWWALSRTSLRYVMIHSSVKRL